MRTELQRLESGRDFAYASIDKMLKSDLIMQRKTQGLTVGGGKTMIVAITSDRGLCGAINSGLIRDIKSRLGPTVNRNIYSIFSIGEKGTSALLRLSQILSKIQFLKLILP